MAAPELRVAIRNPDDPKRPFVGRPGEIHPVLWLRLPPRTRDRIAYEDMGFVTVTEPETYLTREQAEATADLNLPDGELHMADLPEHVPSDGGVQAIERFERHLILRGLARIYGG